MREDSVAATGGKKVQPAEGAALWMQIRRGFDVAEGVVLPNLRLRRRTALALHSGLVAGRRSERNKNRLRGKAPISGNDFVVPDVGPAWGRGKSCGAEPGTNCRVYGRAHSGVANG